MEDDRERHERVKRLFLDVLEVEPAERGAWLDRACADDPVVRAEVDSLLAHHDPLTLFREGEGREAGGPRQLERPDPSQLADDGPDDGPARFAVGTVVAGRYRIVARIGRGGMGEVYRAEDLRLDETVALKFLSPRLREHELWLERLRNEARLAREVTHAAVNRIHDLVEEEGEVFLTMEYVDGEDLGTLLRRIGRLPIDKALQFARELCAGVAAAHDRGVLHRDLKPSNVMLDGRGHVRVTDFGIATAIDVDAHATESAGTPAYMAPEVLAGRPATRASDIYSLGLVLYEILTGRPAFDRSAPAAARRRTPTSPSRWLDDLDPRIEHVILQCLEADPARRPASAHAVAAALPGGDPLQLTLALGQIPSPEMVAAAGGGAVMRPVWVLLVLLGIAVAFGAVVVLSAHTHVVAHARIEKPPEVLAERARTLLRDLGREGPAQDRTGRFIVDGEAFALLETRRAPQPGRDAHDLPLVVYAYREGDARVLPQVPIEDPRVVEELPLGPGMAAVRLRGDGSLLSLAVHPGREEAAALRAQAGEPDWDRLFVEAGLERSAFDERIPPPRVPPTFADSVRVWTSPRPGGPRVEAGAVGPRAVYFDLVPAWRDEVAAPTAEVYGQYGQTDRTGARYRRARVLFLGLMLIVSALLAWRHHRLGIGDLRGAWRLAWFVLGVGAALWLFGQRHVSVFAEESSSAYVGLALATFQAAGVWLSYLALEPYVRRYWPQTLIAWSRLLHARARDPLVGRDLLVGLVLGTTTVLAIQLSHCLPVWLGEGPRPPLLRPGGFDLGGVADFPDLVTIVLHALLRAIPFGLSLLLMMLMLRALVRRTWLVVPAFALAAGTLMWAMGAGDLNLPWAVWAAIAGALGYLFVRVGLLAALVLGLVTYVLLACPLTADTDAWYVGATWFALALLGLAAAFGARTALAGHRLF